MAPRDAAPPSRPLDYFVVCGLGVHLSTLSNSQGWAGFQSENGERICYKPAVVDRYPETDHIDFEIPSCLPIVIYFFQNQPV